jgi:tyrosinase
MSNQIDRRRFLASGAGVAGLFGTTGSPAVGGLQVAPPDNMNLRRNLSDSSATKDLLSYKAAVTAMLKLPMSDSRNWYRNAFIHLLDCPHSNWWLLPWHRGYLGWFEQTCRELSNDETFALPYWDWTSEPYIPPQFSEDDVFNPANAAYFASPEAFKANLGDAINAFYANLSPNQRNQLNAINRGTPEDFWAYAMPRYPNGDRARQPVDSDAQTAVLSSAIAEDLRFGTFEEFASGKQTIHTEISVNECVLEGGAHDSIHVSIGYTNDQTFSSFMGDMLSPIDPLFFMHHCNLDRLWDIWTKKQQANNLPATPTGNDLAAWQREPFLFYIDRKGNPIPDSKAGDYTATSRFNYAYQPGTGVELISRVASPRLARMAPLKANLSGVMVGAREITLASATVPLDLTHPPIEGNVSPSIIARITLLPPKDARGTRLRVLVNAPAGARNIGPGDPSFAGTISFFGAHQHGNMIQPKTFDVSLTVALKKLRSAGKLKKGDPITIQVIPSVPGDAAVQIPVQSVTFHEF